MRVSEFLYPQNIARCQHIKVNGVQCGSPSLKNCRFCFFHQRWHQRRIQINANQARRARYSLDLPLLEDANSIQVALMQVMRLLLTQQIEHKTAALLFYALQTASSNLRATSFEPQPQQVVIDPQGVAETGLGDQAWYKEEFEEDDQDQRVAHVSRSSRHGALEEDDLNRDEPEEEEKPKSSTRSEAIPKIEAVAASARTNHDWQPRGACSPRVAGQLRYNPLSSRIAFGRRRYGPWLSRYRNCGSHLLYLPSQFHQDSGRV